MKKIVYLEAPSFKCLDININGNLRHNIENYQRNYINTFLNENAKEGDTIIVADCDEIPHPNTVHQFKEESAIGDIHKFNTTLYRYYLNLKFQNWLQGFLIKWNSNFVNYNYSYARQKQDRWRLIPSTKNKAYGWHFSYVGNANIILEKITAYHDNRRFIKMVRHNGIKYLNELIRAKKYIHFRNGECTGSVVPINTLPEYVQNNQEKFAPLLLKD